MATDYRACPSCDCAIRKESRFCDTCGVKISEAADAKRSENRESWLRTKLIDWGVLKDAAEETSEAEAKPEAGEASEDGEADDDSGNAGNPETFEVY